MAKRKLKDFQIAAIPKMKALGLTYVDIGELLGVSWHTIYNHFRPGDSPLSPLGEKYLCLEDDDGKKHYVRVNKRKYTGSCELCGRKGESKLHYHHWDDNNPEYGLWLCFRCHMFAEFIELHEGKDMKAVYLELRRKITRETDSMKGLDKVIEVVKEMARYS